MSRSPAQRCQATAVFAAVCLVVGACRPGGEADATARVSLADVSGPTWVLRAWNAEETAPVQPEVTVVVRDGRVSGGSGCNRYSGSIAEGAAPGEVAIGEVAGTRMMCSDEEMAIEERFLAQLGAVRRFELSDGQLELTYEIDGRAGTMLFARQ